MAAIENTIDRLLAANTDQVDPGGDGSRALLLTCTSPGGFKVAPGGALSPASIVFDAIPIGMDGAVVTWSTDGGANITSNGNQAQLAAQDMEMDKAVITASLTFDGATYTRDITIQTVQDGTLGSTTYTWIRYADSSTGAGISNDPTGKAYIGFAYNKATANESNTPGDYQWSLIKGTDGVGVKGADGITYYTWIKYSDNPDGTGLYDLPTATTEYIGIAVNRTVQTESTNKADYIWSKFKGDKGVPGDPGAVKYVWMKYADTIEGAGMSDSGVGKGFIGIAYNKDTPNESTNPADYTWSDIRGEQGFKGDPGSSLYTWLKYSDNADGTGLYDIPTTNTLYVGIAVNKTSQTESTNKADYTWSRFKGADGVSVPGSRGAGFYRATGNVWSDATADATTPGGNVVGDIVTISNGTVSYTKEWNGSAWFVPGAFMSGNLIVEKTIFATALNVTKIDAISSDLGAIKGGSLDIGGSDATSWHVDAVGNMWSGAGSYADAPFKVSNAGVMTAASGTFGGTLSAASGTLGSLHMASGGGIHGGAHTAWGWPAGGQGLRGFYLGPEGLMLGNDNDGRYFVADINGNLYLPGFRHENGQLTLTNPVIVSPRISTPVLDTFAVTAAGGGSVSGQNGTLSNSVTLTVTGNNGPHKIVWNLTRLAGGIPSTPVWMDTADGGRTAYVSATASNQTINVQASATITGSDGRTLNFSDVMTLTFGFA